MNVTDTYMIKTLDILYVMIQININQSIDAHDTVGIMTYGIIYNVMLQVYTSYVTTPSLHNPIHIIHYHITHIIV